MRKKNWKIKNIGEIQKSEYLPQNSVLSKLLAQRGIFTKGECFNFLNPKMVPLIDPFVFSHMERIVSRIEYAIQNNERILIWGDFDSDGVTSSAILYKTFENLGANFTYFIPNRIEHGHGLNSGELIKFITKEKIKLVITVDCGISNIKEVDLLRSFKIDVIITDHHQPSENIPNAYGIMNPKVLGNLAEDTNISDINSLCNLCGAGVAYKLFLALKMKFQSLSKIENEIISLAAIGTISDVVPLRGENRTIVALGLEEINSGALLGVKQLFLEKNDVTSTDIAFILTPRINAAGRLKDAKMAFEFLIEKNLSNVQLELKNLDNLNQIRQELCDQTFNEAMSMTKAEPDLKNKKAIVLLNSSWHVGIIGIVAARIMEEFQRPVFLMTQDETGIIRCSIRSLEGFNVYDILSQLSDYFLGFGGHALAGGFSINPEVCSFEKIKSEILKIIDELYSDITPQFDLNIDLELNPKEINEELLDDIAKLEPYGEENLTPLFCIKNANYLSHKFVGKENNHLKLELEKDEERLHCVFWGQDSFAPPNDNLVDIAFFPKLNIFNNTKTIQLELVDILKKENECEIKIYDHRKKENILDSVDEYLKKPNLKLKVYAKKTSTLEKLKKYPSIYRKIDNDDFNSIMFFDYPIDFETFKKEIDGVSRIHLMKEEFIENIDFYIKQTYGMTKYAINNLNGEIYIEKMAQAQGMSTDFISIVIEIFKETELLKLVNNKMVLNAISLDEVKKSPLFDTLIDEFNRIIEYKNNLAILGGDEIKSSTSM